MNKSVGGTRYVRKIPIPILSPQRPVRRASAYAAGMESNKRDHDHQRPDKGRVPQPANVAGLIEQQLDVVQRGLQVEDERIALNVVEINVLFKGGNHHPIERKGQQHDKEN